jgi:hypothetical protein
VEVSIKRKTDSTRASHRKGRRGVARRWGTAVLVLQVVFGALPGFGKPPDTAELQRKASFIGRMLRFVEWPEDANEPRGARFPFCVAGEPFLSFTLAGELHGTKIQGREVEVRWVKKDVDLRGCDAMFFAGALKGANERWLQKVKGARVLTFGEGKSFLEEGGMIQISYQNEIVHFEVNLDCVRSVGLRIDARLLELAKGVTRGGKAASD